MASAGPLLALIAALVTSVRSQQLGLLSPTSIAVNNPGELGLVSPQQAAAAVAAAALQQQTQNGQHLLYPALYTPYSYYPAPIIQQAGPNQDLQGQLLQNSYPLNHANAVAQHQPQSPFVPSYAYLIANNPYQMVGSTVGHQPPQNYEGGQLAFNDLYHQGYVPPEHMTRILGSQAPTFHQQQYHHHIPHQLHSQETVQYHPDGSIIEHGHFPAPQREAVEPNYHHPSTTTTTPAPSPPPSTRPPTFRTFQGKDYHVNSSRRPSRRRQVKPKKSSESSTRRPPTRTAYTTTYNPYVFRHDSPTRRAFYDQENNTQTEIRPIITSTTAIPTNPDINLTQKRDSYFPFDEERKIYIRHTTRTPDYLNSKNIRNNEDQIDSAWSEGKSFSSAREHTPPPPPSPPLASHGAFDDSSQDSQSYETGLAISSDDPYYFEALTNIDHSGYYVPPPPRSPPLYRHFSDYLHYSPLRDRYRPIHVSDYPDEARYQPYRNPASQTDQVYYEGDPHFDYTGPAQLFGVSGDALNEYSHSKEHALTSLYDIHSPTYKEGYAKPTHKPTLSQDSLDKIYDQNQPKAILNVQSIPQPHENQDHKHIHHFRFTTPVSNYRDEIHDFSHHRSTTESPVQPTLQQTPLLVSPSLSPTLPTHVVQEPTTVRQYATAWPITPPPSYSPDRSKRPSRPTSQLPQSHINPEVNHNDQGRRVIEIESQFRDDYHRKLHTQHHPLPPQLRPHVVHYEQLHNGKALSDFTAPDDYITEGHIPPIPPNIPLVYHPHVLEQNLNNQDRHRATVQPLQFGHRQRARNYNIPDLKEPEEPVYYQPKYDLLESEFKQPEDSKITVGSKEYGKSQHDARNETGTRSGVYFSPLVTLAPPTTPHTHRNRYDGSKPYGQESPFANAISRQPASSFRSYTAPPLSKPADNQPSFGYKYNADLNEKRVTLIEGIPHQFSSSTLRPYEASLSTSAIYHAPPPPHRSNKLLPVPVDQNEMKSWPYSSQAENADGNRHVVSEDGQHYSPYAGPKIEPYHEPISTPYYHQQPMVAPYHQTGVQLDRDPHHLASPYYAARTLKFAGPNGAPHQDSGSIPQRGLGRGRLRRRRRPLWMRLAGRERGNEFSYYPVSPEDEADQVLRNHNVPQTLPSSLHLTSDQSDIKTTRPSYYEPPTPPQTNSQSNTRSSIDLDLSETQGYRKLRHTDTRSDGAMDQTDARTTRPSYEEPPTPPQSKKHLNTRPANDLDKSESQGLRELRETDVNSNTASEEEENSLQDDRPRESFDFPVSGNVGSTVETVKKRRRKQYKHTTPKTAKPRTPAEVKRFHLRQHQQLLQNTKLQPPDRKESWKPTKRRTTTVSSSKKRSPTKRGRGLTSDKITEKNETPDEQQDLSNEDSNPTVDTVQRVTQRRRAKVSGEKQRRPHSTRRRSTTAAPPTPKEDKPLSPGYSLEHLYAPFLKQLQDWDAKNGK